MAEELKKRGMKLYIDSYKDYLSKLRQLRKENKAAWDTRPLKDYHKASQQASKDMKSMGDSAGSLSKRISDLTGSTTNYTRALEKNRTILDDTSGKLRSVSSEASNFKGKFQGVTDLVGKGGKAAFGAFGKVIGSVISKVKILAVALIAVKMGQYIKEATQLAVRNETLAVTFDVVAQRAGFSTEQANAAVAALKATGITTGAATQQLQKMAQANLDWGEAAKLARVAQDAAVISGYDSSVAFSTITRAIQVGSAEILDNFGILVRFSQVYEKYAKEIGKSAAALTEQEKLQARFNSVLKEGEKIAGTYEAAMSTAGKMQGSMARQIEETKVNIGNIFLPLKTLQVELKYKFLKGMFQVTKGLSSFGSVMKIIINVIKNSLVPSFKSVWSVIQSMRDSLLTMLASFIPFFATIKKFKDTFKDSAKEGENFFERLGRGAHSLAQSTVMAFALMKAAIRAVRNEIEKSLVPAILSIIKFLQGDFDEAGRMFEEFSSNFANVGKSFKQTFQTELASAMEEYREEFPDLFKSWEELGVTAEVNMDKITKAIDEQIGELEKQKEALKVQIAIVAKAGKIYDDYAQGVKEAQQNLNDALADADTNLEKSMINAVERREKAMRKLLLQASEQRQKITETANERRKKRREKLHNDILKMTRRFQLQQLQSMRRFSLQDRRLRAEGDVLALMDLRENFALEQQEAKENFDAQKGETKKGASEQADEEKKQLDNRLKEFDESVRKRRDALNAGFVEEVDTMKKRYIEQRIAAQNAFTEQTTDLVQARDNRLRELGKSLQAEASLTQEGMDKIGAAIGTIYGDDGAARALIDGWHDYSQTTTERSMEYIKGEMFALDKAIEDLAIKRARLLDPRAAEVSFAPTTSGAPTGTGSVFNARQGALGVVTGPATFNVEPGVKEAVMFAPLQQGGGSSSLDVNVGGLLKGEGFENASSGTVDSVLNEMVLEFGEALKRLRKIGV